MTKRKPPELKRKPGPKPKSGKSGPEIPELPEIPVAAPEVEGKKTLGRPVKLIADAVTVKLVTVLANANCDEVEAGAALGVHEDTFKAFLAREPEVDLIWQTGKAKGRANLRRAQFAKAMQGNPEMLKWLGRQLLGQQEKSTVEQTGKDGAPIQTETVVKLSDEDRKALREILE